MGLNHANGIPASKSIRLLRWKRPARSARQRSQEVRGEDRSALRSSAQATIWWRHGAALLAGAYLLTSQALYEVPGWSSSAFVLAVLLAGFLVAGQRGGAWKLRFGKWFALPILFVGFCLLRSFGSVPDAAPLDTFAQTASAFLGGAGVALALRAGVRFRAIIYAQLLANLLQIVIVLAGWGPDPAPGDDSFRYAGLTGNPNLLALQLTLGACLIWLMPRKAGMFPCLFAVGAVAFAILVTGSRKGVLLSGFFLVLVILQLFALVPRKRRRWLVAGLLVAPWLIGWFPGPWLFEKLEHTLAVQRLVEYDDSSYLVRLEMIQQGLNLWTQAPLLGHGLEAFARLSGEDTYAHNNYVELLCNTGLVGMLLFYTIHGLVLLRAAQARPWIKVYCWVFVVALLVSDAAYVSYKSKQTIMILMILLVVTTASRALPQAARAKARHSGKGKHRPSLRRFVIEE